MKPPLGSGSHGNLFNIDVLALMMGDKKHLLAPRVLVEWGRTLRACRQQGWHQLLSSSLLSGIFARHFEFGTVKVLRCTSIVL